MRGDDVSLGALKFNYSSKPTYVPVPFEPGPGDDAWLQLESMRWERGESEEDNKDLMRKRLKLLRKMIKTSETLSRLWEEEMSRLGPRGVVMSAGGQEQLTNAFASLQVLRNVTGSTLPVAICHFGDEISEKSKRFIQERVKKVEFVDMAAFPFAGYHLPVFEGYSGPRSREDGYMTKLLALRAAPFKEIVYIDVDSFPLDDPEKLFKEDGYKKTGNIFWPDLWRGKTELFEMLGIEKESPWYKTGDLGSWRDRVGKHFDMNKGEWDAKAISKEALPASQTEAGQLVLDRERHWDVLEYLLFINLHHNITYNAPGVLGDKDTFRAAFGLAGKSKDFNQVTIGPLAGMFDFEKHGIYGEKPRFKTLGQVQLHPNGKMFFHHKTIEKLPATGDPGYRVWPIDLVTTPLSDEQARNMIYGGSEFQSLGKGWLQWGFLDYDVSYYICGFNCTCSLDHMDAVDKICSGRTEPQKEVFDFAFPVTAVKVPPGHEAHKASSMLRAALDLLPEGGI